MKFKTEVIDILERAENVKSFQFFKPKNFEYAAGQFIVINLQHGDEKLEKHFTISSSPTEDLIEITKKLTGHKFSNALNSLKTGDIIKADGPYGKFVINESDKKIAMLSGGIGITPIRSVCKYVTDKKLAIDIILVYGNETKAEIVFKKDFEKMKKSNKKLTVVHVLNQPNASWNGYTGYINEKIIEKEVSDYTERLFYLCGPPEMVKTLNKTLEKMGISRNKIKQENFSGY